VEALRALMVEGSLRGAAARGAGQLLEVLHDLGARREEAVDVLCMRLLEATGYLRHLEAQGEEDLADRQANVEELVATAGSFAAERGGTLADYLAETALLTDADRLSEDADRVLMLTAHNAKGLEFDVVVVAGLEEGLFPHASALEDDAELEEERRLFYVALTRARDEVLLTAAVTRRRFAALGGALGGQVSRFVDEIPPELLERDEAAATAWAPARASSSWPERRAGGWRPARAEVAPARHDARSPAVPAARDGAARRAIGREVCHEVFGRGIVVDAEAVGGDLKCTVRFAAGTKKVMARFLTGMSDGDPA